MSHLPRKEESKRQLKADLSTPYTCTSGMFSATPGILTGDNFSPHCPKETVLASAGKAGTIFWFLFEIHSPHSQAPPRYTLRDVDKPRQSLADFRVMPEATSGDVDKNTVLGSKIPIQEGAAPTWHTSRSVLVGDAARLCI